MLKIFKLFIYFVFMFVATSCGYDEKKHYPMPALDGLVIVIPFTDKANTGIKKTGQSKSYDGSGNEVTDNSVKDDGFYQVGTAHDYGRDNANEIVFDRVTKLMWQDNEDAKEVKETWINAKNYCESLTVGTYSDWRLPTIVELKTIIRYDKSTPPLDDVFVNSRNIIYWSSIDKVTDMLWLLYRRDAWYVDFYAGIVAYTNKSRLFNVRCVNSTFL